MKRFMELLLIVLFTIETQRSSAAPISWTQFQGDARHTGHIAKYVAPDSISHKWTATKSDLNNLGLRNGAGTGAVTDGSHVYVTGYIGKNGLYTSWKVYALNAATGTIDWSQGVTAWLRDVSAPVVGNGMVYVHQTGHSGAGQHEDYPRLTGLSAATGAVVFSTEHASQGVGLIRPTVAGTQVFAEGGYTGGLDSYNSITGAKQWFAGLPQQHDWIPAVDDDNVYGYMGPAGTWLGGLWAINRTTGARSFTIQDPADTFTLYRGSVVLGGQNDALAFERLGVLASFDLSTRSVRWRASGGYEESLAVDDGILFVRSGSNVSLLRESDGAQLSTWSAPAALTSNILVSENLIFAGTNSTTYAIDRATLQTVWSTPIGGDLALGDGMLLISNNNGVTAFSAVPEPSGYTLLMIGGSLIGWTARHRVFRRSSAVESNYASRIVPAKTRT